MPNYSRYKSSITNNTNVYGIMGGLASRRLVGISSMNRATSRLVIPQNPIMGMQFMRKHNLLSRNPQCSGGVGRVARTNCRYKNTITRQKTDSSLGDSLGASLGGSLGGSCIAVDISSLTACLVQKASVITVSGPITISAETITIPPEKTVKILNNSGFYIASNTSFINNGHIIANNISETHDSLYNSIIYNEGNFYNGVSSAGTFDINLSGGSGNRGIYNNNNFYNGSYDGTAPGTITTTMYEGSGNQGIYNSVGDFYNGSYDGSAAGTITTTMKDGTRNQGIYNLVGDFYNGSQHGTCTGTIDISLNSGSGNKGIHNWDTFYNGSYWGTNAGKIDINLSGGTGNEGIHNNYYFYNGGAWSTAPGTITTTMYEGSGNQGIYNDDWFVNGYYGPGTIDISLSRGSGNWGIYNDDFFNNGTYDGSGLITIDTSGSNNYAGCDAVINGSSGSLLINETKWKHPCVGKGGATGSYVNPKITIDARGLPRSHWPPQRGEIDNLPYCCTELDTSGLCIDASKVCSSNYINVGDVSYTTCLTDNRFPLCEATTYCVATTNKEFIHITSNKKCKQVFVVGNITIGQDISINMPVTIAYNASLTIDASFVVTIDVARMRLGHAWDPDDSQIHNMAVRVYGVLNNNGVIHFSGDIPESAYGIILFNSGEMLDRVGMTNNGQIKFDNVSAVGGGSGVSCWPSEIDGSGSICAYKKKTPNQLCDCVKPSNSMCSSTSCPLPPHE